jgi:hypothetical protein
MGINGVETKGLRSWNWVSCKDCVEFHKLRVFTCDVAEEQASCMMSSLKKPIKKMTIHQHTMRMEILNGYLMYLPTLKDSPMALASTEKNNKPFSKAALARMIMVTCSIAWSNQYNLTHKTVPKSPRTILPNLENIKKIIVKNYNEKAKANKAKVATASKAGEAQVPKKRTVEDSSDQVPKKGHPLSIATGARLMEGPKQPVIRLRVANMRRMAV